MQSLHGQITVGTLILQNCTVGLLFALLPVLGGSHGVGEGLVSLIRTSMLMCLFLGVAIALSRSLVCRAFTPYLAAQRRAVSDGCRRILSHRAWISEHLGLNSELGAVVAGVMISATPYAEQTLHHIEPIRNVFALYSLHR